jgi:hypothetical protein
VTAAATAPFTAALAHPPAAGHSSAGPTQDAGCRTCRVPYCRPGATLVEVLVGMTAGALFIVLLTGLLAAELRRARTAAEHTARQDALRVSWSVIGAELRFLAAADIHALGGDSIAIRAIRGLLLPCAPNVYRFRGMRLPDPAKDSVVAVVSGAALAFRAGAQPPADACGEPVHESGSGARLYSLPDPAPFEPLLLFEPGAYHLQGRALRYRLGGEGRQPLTGEWFDNAGSGLAGDATALARLRLAPRRVRSTHEAATAAVSIRFWSLNQPVPQGWGT